jgi:hypothetical protein
MNKYILNLILVIASFIISRYTFYLMNDPEGPNLLIVTILAIVIFSILRLIIRFLLKRS